MNSNILLLKIIQPAAECTNKDYNQIRIENARIFYKQLFFSNSVSVLPSFSMNWASNVA